MTDIVERLRTTANCGIPDFTNSRLLDEAADEIERLRNESIQIEYRRLDAMREIERLREKLLSYTGNVKEPSNYEIP